MDIEDSSIDDGGNLTDTELLQRGLKVDLSSLMYTNVKRLTLVDDIDTTCLDSIKEIDCSNQYDIDAIEIYMSVEQFRELDSIVSRAVGEKSFRGDEKEGYIVISDSERMTMRIKAECEYLASSDFD